MLWNISLDLSKASHTMRLMCIDMMLFLGACCYTNWVPMVLDRAKRWGLCVCDVCVCEINELNK